MMDSKTVELKWGPDGLIPAVAQDAFEAAVAEITESTTRLLAQLPERRTPNPNLPPLRRPSVIARRAAKAAAAG